MTGCVRVDAYLTETVAAVLDALQKIPGIGFAFSADMFASNAECKDLPDLERSVCLSAPARTSL